jgi:hypothetical protein
MAEATSSVTYFSKSATECPICGSSFYREEMRTGRGRLNAGDLTEELRRNYIPSQKYGEVFPLIYPVTVCPSCYYSSYPQDFPEVPEESKSTIDQDTDRRIASIRPIFENLDYTEPRGLPEGCASYYFALLCYDHFPPEFSPTFKQGLSSLRAAWLCNDLHKKYPSENYDYLARAFYRKARFFYTSAIEREQSGSEGLSAARNMGPDLDKNYGYDGALYISGLLEFRYGPRKDRGRRHTALQRAKRTIARIFGMGRASREKPQAILDNARDVYEEIAKELGDENFDPEKYQENAG